MIFAIFATLLWASFCIADFDNIFNIPPPAGPANDYSGNSVWTVGSSQEINFVTNYDAWTLSLIRQDPQEGYVDFISNITSDTRTGHISFNWTVNTYDSDLSQSHVYLLWINYGQDTNFNSHYFNMSAPTSTSLASTLATSTITASFSASSTPATTATTAAGTATSSAAAAPAAASSSGSGPNIGLGVGLGLGVPIVLAAAGFGIWRFWAAKRNKNGPTIVTSESKYGMLPSGHGGEPMKQSVLPVEAYSEAVYEAPTNAAGSAGQLYEVAAEQPPMELPTEVQR